MNIRYAISGAVRVSLTSADPEQALANINAAGIPLSKVGRRDSLTYRFTIPRRDLASLRRIAAKRGEELTVEWKLGLYWRLCDFLRRPVLVAGLLVFCFATLLLPDRILFVQVQGNRLVPEKQILSAAESCGISFGANREAVRSEKVKNALIRQIPRLQWVGVNTAGCVATISVRERAETPEEEPPYTVSKIVAARDGFILSGTVTKGNGLFQAGQSVKKGQVLISGYTDCGFCIQATRAEGEILAQTNRQIDVITPEICLHRGEKTAVKRHLSLLLGKKRINLWKDSGISDATCDRIYTENYVTLPGGFRLPIALCVDTVTVSDLQAEAIPEPESQALLTESAKRHLQSQMVAGSIQNAQVDFRLSDGIYHLTGSYVCTEMIGREQQEQIGEANGKNN